MTLPASPHTTSLALAATVAMIPGANVVALVAFGVGTLWCVIELCKEFGGATTDAPARCPACRRDDLLRIDASIVPPPVPLLHCRSCGEAFYWHAGSLIRDTGRPLF